MSLENLLQKVSAINKKYENIAEITGEKFNIFKILKMESDEVKTHSAFLAELLNPKGSHGQKDSFLKLFIQMFGFKKVENLDLSDIEIKVEEVIDDGRIDIVIKPKQGREIVIENKIYASDRPMQLSHYKKAYKNCHLLYLTLDGKEPDKSSVKDNSTGKVLEKGEDYFTISYKENILKWLEECKKEATNHPILRETLTQYIYLIKYLTHQTMNQLNKDEIVKTIVTTPDNIESAEYIINSWTDVKYKIIDNLKTAIEKEYENNNEIHLYFDTYDIKLGEQDSCFWFRKNDWGNDGIFFYFNTDLDSMIFGIDNVDKKIEINKNFESNIYERLKKTNRQSITYESRLFFKFEAWNVISWKEKETKIPGEIRKLLIEILEYLKAKPL